MRVLIMGVAGALGRLLAARLLADPGISAVAGVDDRVFRAQPAGLRYVRADLHQPEWLPLLAQTEALVHLWGSAWPVPRREERPLAVETSKSVLRAAAQAGVARVITLCGAAVYGPQPAGPVREDAPVRGHVASLRVRSWALIADYLDTLEQDAPRTVFTRLRAAWIVGPQHSALADYFAAGPGIACGRETRRWQAVHEADVIEAIVLALRPDHPLPGVAHVAADEGLPLGDAAALAGRTDCAPLGWLLLRAVWDWRWRGRAISPAALSALVGGPPLAVDRLRAAGWTPRYTTREALAAALDAR